MKIIGIAGRARAGKDSAATRIADWAFDHGADHIKTQGFADLLKLSAFRALGGAPDVPIEKAVDFCNRLKGDGGVLEVTAPWPDAEIWPSYDITGREFLQRYGTEAHRSVFGTDFWVEALFDYVEASGPEFGYDLLIIPDCRFDNEADAVVERGGEVWEVTRPQHEDELKSGLEHVSETGANPDLIDVRVNNDGTLEDLTFTISSLCEQTIGGEQ